MPTTTLTPDSTESSFLWTSTPSHPDIHLDIDDSGDETDYVESSGFTSVFRVGMTNPPSINGTWNKATFRVHGARISGASSPFLKFTLHVDGTAEESVVIFFATISPDIGIRTATIPINNYTTAQLDSAAIEVEHTIAFVGDMRITFMSLGLFGGIVEEGSGGAIAGGLADIDFIDFIEGVGGALSGGVATVALSDVVEVGGGALTGGVAEEGRLLTEAPVGGVLAGGIAEEGRLLTETPVGGALAGGLATATFFDQIDGVGGVLAGGLATVSFFDQIDGTGGVLAGGLADLTQVFNPAVAGGVLAGGLADINQVFNPTATGGTLAGGLADPDFIDIVEVGGGALVGGHGALIFDDIAIGGALSKGIASITRGCSGITEEVQISVTSDDGSWNGHLLEDDFVKLGKEVLV